jgi:GntR family transcriptional regulator
MDRTSPVPLYYQLKLLLLEKIERGEWARGALIPSEKELEATYGLSRTTVRQALGELTAEGLLYRRRGRGTFVAHAKLTYDAVSGIEANGTMRERGITLEWRLLDSTWISAPAYAAQALGIAPGNRVFCIRRLRLAGEDVMGYHIAYLPEWSAQRIDVERMTDGDSLAYLRRMLPRRSPRIERTLEARLSGDLEGALIGLEVGAPVLHLERVVFDSAERPLEYLKAAYSGDRLKYRLVSG